MDPIIWPTRLLVPGNVKLSMQSVSRGGGQTIEGNEQVVASPASQRWALTFSNIAIRTADQVRAWRAIEAQADGRANTLVMPIYDRSRGPVRAQLEQGISFAGSTFLPQVSSIRLTEDAAIGATSLSVAWSDAAAPLPGQHFSIGTSLHRVAQVASTGSLAATLTVRPWLRASASAGASLNFDDPVCLMRLANDDAMASFDLQLWRFASPSVDFVQAF